MTVQTHLDQAADLERRDTQAAETLAAVERLQAEVDALRTEGAAVAAFLDRLPAATAERADDLGAARDERAAALAALEHARAELAAAKKDDAVLAARRAVQQAEDRLHAAGAWVEQAEGAVAALAADAVTRRRDAARFERTAAALAARPPLDLPPPSGGLAGALDWASQARGALVLARAAAATERERLVREATELLAGLTGEPLVVGGVAGLRERLQQALADG